jgi:hypothetical protein
MLTNLFYVSLAYKAAVTPLMVTEASFYAKRLSLPSIRAAEVSVSVNSPLHGLGHLQTKEFVYSFPGNDEMVFTNRSGSTRFLEHGKLAYVMKKEPFQTYGSSIAERYAKLASLPSNIDTNGAYRLAREWLNAVDVDIAALERDYRPLVVQEAYYDAPLTPKKANALPTKEPTKKLPVFDITWGGPNESGPPVWVQILGTTKELLLFRMEDTRYSRRPPIVVSNAFALCGLPQPKLPLGRHRANIGDLLRVSVAYSNAVTKLMLNEVNLHVERLDLPVPHPLKPDQVSVHINTPAFFGELGYIESAGYRFWFPEPDNNPATNQYGFVRFIEAGKLASIEKLNAFREFLNEFGELDERLLKRTMLLDTNAAYHLSTQWLAAININLSALEDRYKPQVVQMDYRSEIAPNTKLPVFEVSWGGPAEHQPPVSMQISGLTKELLALRIQDTQFSHRPPVVVTNATELNNQLD